MQAVKGRNTSLERIVATAFRERGWRTQRHVKSLPGRPDFVLHECRIAVFVDGDFWHGWQYPRWKDKLTQYWQTKIERTRLRDRRIRSRLRSLGWTVVRIWGHQVEGNLPAVLHRLEVRIRQFQKLATRKC